MPTSWGDILKELAQATAGPLPPGVSACDVVRRKYLGQLHHATGRNAVLYASKWTQAPAEPELVSIVPEDLQGLMEVLNGLPHEKGLDIVLHSPGGSAEAVESLVKYVRSLFADVRVIVPHAAMSAATMLACAADRILMGTHSFLGPIDPQFIMQTETGRSAVPAQAILAQFELAKKECADPSLLPAWIPMLRQYGPALLIQCQLAQDLSRSLVTEWLEKYMFAREPDAKTKAEGVARSLSDHAVFKSHGRFIDRQQARDNIGLIVDDLEADSRLEDATLALFHAATHTFNATPAVKLLENHQGRAFIKLQQVLQPQGPLAAPLPRPAAPSPTPPPPPLPSA